MKTFIVALFAVTLGMIFVPAVHAQHYADSAQTWAYRDSVGFKANDLAMRLDVLSDRQKQDIADLRIMDVAQVDSLDRNREEGFVFIKATQYVTRKEVESDLDLIGRDRERLLGEWAGLPPITQK